MSFTAIVACIGIACAAALIWNAYHKSLAQRQLQKHSITPDALHAMMAAHQPVLVFDVRQPLDLLADSEVIPGAQRIPPRDVLADPSLIPREKETVIYCTCPGDETSQRVLRLALANGLSRTMFLKGGLAAWKAQGYPVEPYTDSFRLDVKT